MTASSPWMFSGGFSFSFSASNLSAYSETMRAKMGPYSFAVSSAAVFATSKTVWLSVSHSTVNSFSLPLGKILSPSSII